MSTHRQQGFTLLEILVSILIFSIVSIAMIGILAAATKIFRVGESSRAAHDDAVAVLAQLDDDLQHMVPGNDGGFMYARVRPDDLSSATYVAHASQTMMLAMKIRNPDVQAAVGATTVAAMNDDESKHERLIVVWFVNDDGDLCRGVADAADGALDSAGIPIPESKRATDAMSGGVGGNSAVISKKCLYFGVDLSLDQADANTGSSVGVRPTIDWDGAEPQGQHRFCTEDAATLANPDDHARAFPRALRVTVTLTGGSRNVLRGTVVSDDTNGIRVSGIGQFPLGPGAVARIGDGSAGKDFEWIRYDQAPRGLLTYQGARPTPIRRTTQVTHDRGAQVAIGTSYSMVRTIPR